MSAAMPYAYCMNRAVNCFDVLGLTPSMPYPQPGPTPLSPAWDCKSAALKCRECIQEWRRLGYDFAADLFEYYLDTSPEKGGFVASNENIKEIKNHSSEKICGMVKDVACAGSRYSKKIQIEPKDKSDSNIRWWYIGSDKNMLYAYGGGRLTVSGLASFECEKKWHGIFNVEIEDYYEWVKDDGAMDKIKEFLSRLASSAYDAAVYMQKNCGNKSFGHKESFSLECNGCCE